MDSSAFNGLFSVVDGAVKIFMWLAISAVFLAFGGGYWAGHHVGSRVTVADVPITRSQPNEAIHGHMFSFGEYKFVLVQQGDSATIVQIGGPPEVLSK